MAAGPLDLTTSSFSTLPSISITLHVRIFCTNVVFPSYMYVEKPTFVQKICTYNVDEIDTSRVDRTPDEVPKLSRSSRNRPRVEFSSNITESVPSGFQIEII